MLCSNKKSKKVLDSGISAESGHSSQSEFFANKIYFSSTEEEDEETLSQPVQK